MASVFDGVPALQHPDIAGRYLSAFQGGQDRALEEQKRQTLSDIGGQMANGDLSGAANAALRSGNLDAGMKIQGMQDDRQTQALTIMAKMAQHADTPEKWAEYTNYIHKRIPNANLPGFDQRDAVLAEFAQAVEPKVVAAGGALVDPQTGQEMYRNPAAGSTNSPYETLPDGSMRARTGGPADPAVIKSQSEARGAATRLRTLPQTTVDKISSAGEGVVNMDRLTSTFRDEFGGFTTAGIGNAANWVARNLGAGEQGTATADWWQDYQRQKNVVRNQLFGSALTATEKGEFERADINPGMKPTLIKKNLERQHAAVMRAATKIASGYIKQGYAPDVIEAYLGVSLKELGIDVPAPQSPTVPSEPPDPNAMNATETITGDQGDAVEGDIAVGPNGEQIILRGGQWEPL